LSCEDGVPKVPAVSISTRGGDRLPAIPKRDLDTPRRIKTSRRLAQDGV